MSKQVFSTSNGVRVEVLEAGPLSRAVCEGCHANVRGCLDVSNNSYQFAGLQQRSGGLERT